MASAQEARSGSVGNGTTYVPVTATEPRCTSRAARCLCRRLGLIAVQVGGAVGTSRAEPESRPRPWRRVSIGTRIGRLIPASGRAPDGGVPAAAMRQGYLRVAQVVAQVWRELWRKF